GKRYERIFFYQTGPLTNILPFTWFKKIWKYRITIWTQDLWPETLFAYGIPKNFLTERTARWLVKRIYRKGDIILASCKGFIPKLEMYNPKLKAQWIPNWSLIQSNATIPAALPNGYHFTFAGNIGKVQNLENILLGFQPVTEQFPQANLTIVGDGSNL